MTTYIAELATVNSTPALEVSLLRHRVKAVQIHGPGLVFQVGLAWGFELMEIRGRLALVCRVELDDERMDQIRHRLADSDQLFIETYPLIRAVAP